MGSTRAHNPSAPPNRSPLANCRSARDLPSRSTFAIGARSLGRSRAFTPQTPCSRSRPPDVSTSRPRCERSTVETQTVDRSMNRTIMPRDADGATSVTARDSMRRRRRAPSGAGYPLGRPGSLRSPARRGSLAALRCSTRLQFALDHVLDGDPPVIAKS